MLADAISHLRHHVPHKQSIIPLPPLSVSERAIPESKSLVLNALAILLVDEKAIQTDIKVDGGRMNREQIEHRKKVADDIRKCRANNC